MGLVLCKKAPQQNGTSVSEPIQSSGEDELDEDRGSGRKSSEGEEVVRAVYAFSGSNEDEVSLVQCIMTLTYVHTLTHTHTHTHTHTAPV